MSTILLKERVGFYAYNYVKPLLESIESIGLGTGSTIKFFIDKLISDGVLAGLRVTVSSIDTLLYLSRRGVTATPPGYIEHLDLYVDGFDEVSSRLDIVKGRGGALHWEKQLALIADRRIYIGDYTKYNGKPYLYLKPIPIEVSPPSLSYVLKSLSALGKPVLRMGRRKDGPIITDTGNYIVDLYTNEVHDAEEIDKVIKEISGVVETGLFPRKLVDTVIITTPHGVVRVYGERS